MVDSGATQNFVSNILAKELELPITENNVFGVVVAEREIRKGRGKCAGVILEVQEIEIMEDSLMFDLGESTYVAMRYSWLATLGDIRINWELRTLSWKIGD